MNSFIKAVRALLSYGGIPEDRIDHVQNVIETWETHRKSCVDRPAKAPGTALSPGYLEGVIVHVDEGGRIGEGCAKDLLRELERLQWRPLNTAPTNTYVEVRGPSGYVTTPHRIMIAICDLAYRPAQPWVDPAGDSVLDGGVMPIEWRPLS